MYLIKLAQSGDDALFGTDHGDVLIGKASTHTEPGPLTIERPPPMGYNTPLIIYTLHPNPHPAETESSVLVSERVVNLKPWALGHEKYDYVKEIGYCPDNQTWYVRDAGRLGGA